MSQPTETMQPVTATSTRGWAKYGSKRMRQERKAAGLTQVELAQQTGIHHSHISRLENGLRPSRKTLAKIAAVLKPVAEMGIPALNHYLAWTPLNLIKLS